MIAIPNMDMPEHCYECLLRQGNCCLLLYKATPPTVPLTRLDDCPLIEIEDTEYEWCHDCKEYDQEKHSCPRWTKVIRNTVAELEEHYGKYITKHDKTLVIDYPDTDDIQTILLIDDEGFTRVFEERRSDERINE